QNAAREVGIVLPVGCGKSGLIAITPFAAGARRVLVVTPGLRIRDQLASDLKASSGTNFYARCEILDDPQTFPEAAVMSTGRINRDDLEHSDIVIANIHQVAGGEENRLLGELGENFFDLVLMDEGHHNTAESWQVLKEQFPRAR